MFQKQDCLGKSSAVAKFLVVTNAEGYSLQLARISIC